MKKRWKIFWIVCAVLGSIGIACLVIAAGMGVTMEIVENRFPNGISIGKFETENTVEDETELEKQHSFDEIRGLDIDLTAGELKILVSNDRHISIETEGISRKLNLRYYRDGDDLVLTSEKGIFGNVTQRFGIVYIYLPENYQLQEAKINVHAGTLYIEDIHAQELSVDVGAGEAVIDDFEANESDLDCGAGEIRACGTVENVMDIDCGMGRVDLSVSDREDNYNYDLACGIGKIECGSNSYSGIGGDQKVGNNASKEMNIDCGVGEVVVKFEEHHEGHHFE